MTNSLWPHGPQNARPPCPLSPRVCLNSCSLSWWYHPTISSSVTPFSCPQSFPASRSFLLSWLFASGGQSIKASASATVLPMNIQGLFSLGLTGLISLLPKGISRVFYNNTIIWKNQYFNIQPCYGPTLTSVQNFRSYLIFVALFIISKILFLISIKIKQSLNCMHLKFGNCKAK